MKYYNKENKIVLIGPRESIQPYGVTRDLTDKEVNEVLELRYAIKDRGYLIPYDGETPLPKQPRTTSAVDNYQMSPDAASGEKVSKKVNGKVVEYIVADTKGTDHVQNASLNPEVLASLPASGRPTEYIEEAVSGRDSKGKMKTQWKSAAQALEEQLKRESEGADIDFSDDANLAEGDDHKRPEALDVDAEIKADYTRVLQKNGTMGASLVTTKEIAENATMKATATLAEALKPDCDDGELVEGASDEVTKFLKQPFFGKKWIISKSADAAFLTAVAAATKSENVKGLCEQRLAELEKAEKKS
jgi:hypothetical protein